MSKHNSQVAGVRFPDREHKILRFTFFILVFGGVRGKFFFCSCLFITSIICSLEHVLYILSDVRNANDTEFKIRLGIRLRLREDPPPSTYICTPPPLIFKIYNIMEAATTYTLYVFHAFSHIHYYKLLHQHSYFLNNSNTISNTALFSK